MPRKLHLVVLALVLVIVSRARTRTGKSCSQSERHTLVFRFFGDDATFRPLPDHSDAGYARNGVLFVEEMKALEPRDPFRSPVFRQLV